MKGQNLKSYIHWSQMNIIFKTKKAFEWKVAFKLPFREKNLKEMNQIFTDGSNVDVTSAFLSSNEKSDSTKPSGKCC